jgi:hypothetical protein
VFTPGRAWVFPDSNAPVLLLSSAGAPGFGQPPLTGAFALRSAALPPAALAMAPLQADFANGWRLYGYTLAVDSDHTPAEVRLATFWQVGAGYIAPPPRPVDVLSGTPLPFKFFSHVLRSGGSLVAGDDRLDVDPATLRPGDRFIQTFAIELPAGLPNGDYPVQVGVYDPASGARTPLTTGADAVIVNTVTLTP